MAPPICLAPPTTQVSADFDEYFFRVSPVNVTNQEPSEGLHGSAEKRLLLFILSDTSAALKASVSLLSAVLDN